MKICGYLNCDRIFLDIEPAPKPRILEDIVDRLHAQGAFNKPEKVLRALEERETLGSTGLDHGIALPHALIDGLRDPILSVTVIREGTDYQALDQEPTFVLILLLGPVDEPGRQLRILAHICRLIKETSVVEKIRKAGSAEDICDIFAREEETIV